MNTTHNTEALNSASGHYVAFCHTCGWSDFPRLNLSPMREHYTDLSGNGQTIYDALVARELGVKS